MKKYLLLLLLQIVSTSVMADDKVEVVSFKETKETLAKDNQQLDINGEICALIIISSDDVINNVEGNYIPNAKGNAISKKNGEYWIYMTTGSSQIRLLPEKHLPLMVNFKDYNIRNLKGGVTYRMKLTANNKVQQGTSNGGGKNKAGKGKAIVVPSENYAIITVKPKDAVVEVDKRELTTEKEDDSAVANVLLPAGKHSYKIRYRKSTMDEYVVFEGNFTIVNDAVELSFDLSTTGSISMAYFPNDAKVFINNKLQETSGCGVFRKQLPFGTYDYRVEYPGCKPQQGKFKVKDHEEIAVALEMPPLKESLPSGTKKVFKVNGVSFNMIFVEGGDNVTSFYLGETEVTEELWDAVMGVDPDYSEYSRGPKYAKDRLGWKMANEFVQKLSKLTKTSFHIPTEAQWNWAAKGGKLSKGYKYTGSDNLKDVAWYSEDLPGKETVPKPVATKLPNELGIYDLMGNMGEWVCDAGGESTIPERRVNPIKLKGSAHIGREWRLYKGPGFMGYNHNIQFKEEDYRRSYEQRLEWDEYKYTRSHHLGLRLAIY